MQIDVTKSDLDAIVKFLERKSTHLECEDCWYSCPLSEEYCGTYSDTPREDRPCECGATEAQRLLNILVPYDRFSMQAGEIHEVNCPSGLIIHEDGSMENGPPCNCKYRGY